MWKSEEQIQTRDRRIRSADRIFGNPPISKCRSSGGGLQPCRATDGTGAGTILAHEPALPPRDFRAFHTRERRSYPVGLRVEERCA